MVILYYNIHVSCQIILTFCTDRGSTIVVPCAKFQNEAIETYVLVSQDLVRVQFEIRVGLIVLLE